MVTEQQNKERKVYVIWTDKSTGIKYESHVDFETKLDFDKMENVIISM